MSSPAPFARHAWGFVPSHGERFNFYSHLLALALALAGMAWTLPMAVATVSWPALLGVAVYGCTQVLAFAASCALHLFASGPRAETLKGLDHAAIYGLIAGTYTPYAVLSPAGGWCWALLLLLWAGALAGAVREARGPAAEGPSLLLYAGMGWAAVMGALPMAATAGTAACAWLLVGAAFYSAGTVFYRNPRGHLHAHGVWHLMVLGGAASHFVSIVLVLAAVGRIGS